MFLNNSFGKTVDILHRSMDASMIRRSVISNNIANTDTSNFKRTDVNFEAELKRALDSEDQPAGLRAKMTDPRHIPFNRPSDYRDVEPRRVLDYLSMSKNNGNNVDIEVETMNSLQNQLSYNLMTTAISSQFTQVNMVLR